MIQETQLASTYKKAKSKFFCTEGWPKQKISYVDRCGPCHKPLFLLLLFWRLRREVTYCWKDFILPHFQACPEGYSLRGFFENIAVVFEIWDLKERLYWCDKKMWQNCVNTEVRTCKVHDHTKRKIAPLALGTWVSAASAGSPNLGPYLEQNWTQS